MKAISLYTDGACSGNPGRGGWAAVAVDESEMVIMKTGEGYRRTTNNRMEILAAADGLQELYEIIKKGRDTDIKVTVFSDSQLVVNTMEKGWRRNSNDDLWKRLDESMDLFPSVGFIKVKGHSNDKFNNLADETAVFYSQEEQATCIDGIYENINAPKKETPALFDRCNEDMDSDREIVSTEPEIVEIRLKNANVKEIRVAEIELSNGTTVKVRGTWGGFEQYDCNRFEAAVTVDVAKRLSGWLNGKAL